MIQNDRCLEGEKSYRTGLLQINWNIYIASYKGCKGRPRVLLFYVTHPGFVASFANYRRFEVQKIPSPFCVFSGSVIVTSGRDLSREELPHPNAGDMLRAEFTGVSTERTFFHFGDTS